VTPVRARTAFVLAVLTCCSSSSSTTDTAPADAGIDVRIAPEASDDDGGACPVPPDPANPVDQAYFDQRRPWKPAKPAAGSCDKDDLAQLAANLNDETIKSWFELGKDISASCKACAIGADTDPTWAPIIGTTESNGDTGFFNFGACFGYVDESDACGKALQYEQFCYSLACSDCTTTRAERVACVKEAGKSTGLCGPFVTKLLAECNNLDVDRGKCAEIVDSVWTLCGSPADAGSEAAADASDM